MVTLSSWSPLAPEHQKVTSDLPTSSNRPTIHPPPTHTGQVGTWGSPSCGNTVLLVCSQVAPRLLLIGTETIQDKWQQGVSLSLITVALDTHCLEGVKNKMDVSPSITKGYKWSG